MCGRETDRQADRQRRKPSKVACVILLDVRVWRIGEVDMIVVECVSSVLTSLLREREGRSLLSISRILHVECCLWLESF